MYRRGRSSFVLHKQVGVVEDPAPLCWLVRVKEVSRAEIYADYSPDPSRGVVRGARVRGVRGRANLA